MNTQTVLKQPEHGFVVAFDGVDYSGKGTHIKLLSEELDRAGIPYVVVAEPNGSEANPFGCELRELFMRNLNQMAPEVEVAMLLASQKQNLEKVVKPALAEGKIVIRDRSEATTMAYQGVGRDYDLDMITDMIDAMRLDVISDLQIYTIVSPDNLAKRRAARGVQNTLDAQSPEFYHNINEAFFMQSQVLPDCLLVNSNAVDGLSDEETIAQNHTAIVQFIANYINKNATVEEDAETTTAIELRD